MAEGMFSKDSRRVPGPAAKDGGLLSTQKNALRDVKNTLQSHSNIGRSASKPFLESFNSVPVKQDLGSRSVIYCDSNNQFWDPCDCSKTDDGLGFPRLPGEYLHSTDFSYVMRGLVGIPSSNYGNDCDYNDVECSYLGEPFFQNLPDIIDMLPVPTEIYLPTIDLDFDPPSLIDVEDE